MGVRKKFAQTFFPVAPWSMAALLFSILLELRIQMVLHDISLPHLGHRGAVAYLNDTTYLLETTADVQHLFNNLYQTCIRTHLLTCTT